MKKILAGLLVLGVVLAGLVFPSMPAAAQQQPKTAELLRFEQNGGKLVYLGKSYDLDGWLLVDRSGKPKSVVYVSPMGALLVGKMFSGSGHNITKSQLEVYNARTSGAQDAIKVDNVDKDATPKSELFYADLEKGNWVRVGKPDAPYIYMFINVNCEHCQTVWRMFKGSVDKGMLQLRLVPAGEQDANLNGGAALLSVDDPGQAWQDFMDGKKGTLDKTLIKGDALDKMAANNKLAKKWKLPQYPFEMYRKVSDGSLIVVEGEPSNPMQVMGDLMKIE